LKKLALLGAVVGAGIAGLVVSSQAADHLDAPTIAMTANRMADINDVYAWMTDDAGKVNLAMTVSPADDGTRSFGPSILYVFHVTSRPGFLQPGTETQIRCKFASNTSAECWVVSGSTTKDYLQGDPSNAATPVTSHFGHVKMFAGRRSDPFFFNLHGFKKAVSDVKAFEMSGAAMLNNAGCPTNVGAAGGALVADLSETPLVADAPCPANIKDCFAGFNVMAIVLQVDKDQLLGNGQTLLSVWGSTHTAQ